MPIDPNFLGSTERIRTFDLREQDELARRFARFAAAFVDGCLMLAIGWPMIHAAGYVQRMRLQQVGFLEQAAIFFLGAGVFLLLNGYLLANRGQTVGKFLAKIQVVHARTGKLLPFLKLYVFRYLWALPLLLLYAVIPYPIISLLMAPVPWLDSLMIFTSARRCLHDYIANTKVVLYRPGREIDF